MRSYACRTLGTGVGRADCASRRHLSAARSKPFLADACSTTCAPQSLTRKFSCSFFRRKRQRRPRGENCREAAAHLAERSQKTTLFCTIVPGVRCASASSSDIFTSRKQAGRRPAKRQQLKSSLRAAHRSLRNAPQAETERTQRPLADFAEPPQSKRRVFLRRKSGVFRARSVRTGVRSRRRCLADTFDTTFWWQKVVKQLPREERADQRPARPHCEKHLTFRYFWVEPKVRRKTVAVRTAFADKTAFTGGSTREFPAAGPASGRGTGWA